MAAEDFDIDKAVEFLLEGKTYVTIAEHFNCSISTIHREFSKEEYSARAREALVASADQYADKAEKVLIEAEWDENMGDFDLKKAKELSQFYRWKAAKRNPKRYAERVDMTTDGEKIQPSIPIIQWVGGDKS